MKKLFLSSALAPLLLLAGCASSNAVDMAEPRRIVGTENLIRVDALVTGEEVRPGTPVPITYEITNQRTTAIAIADLVPETTFDPETRTYTVNIGSEVPGNQLLPRLVSVGPGEKKTFTTAARVTGILAPRSADPRAAAPPVGFRLRINFLGDTKPFEQLIGIPENGVADQKLADELFPLWLDRNEVVYTNVIPMRVSPRPRDPFVPSAAPTRRGGRG